MSNVEDFSVTEHIIPAQYIREYPHAVKSDSVALQLVIKEYRPLVTHDDSQNAVTIIATHANGIPKETYEPMWNELVQLFQGNIRSIWFADSVHQGASGVLNERFLGDDPCWFDHSRDLLAMINHFRDRISRPIVGVGHSMGCGQLVQLSLMHPRLLDSLVLIEPIIQDREPPGSNPALPSSYRPDRWPSREVAEASFRKSKFFQVWDSRCLDAYVAHGLRPLPTALYAEGDAPGGVTLTTTKAQEAWSYVRSNFAPLPDVSPKSKMLERRAAPALIEENRRHLFDCAEMIQLYNNLPQVRPPVLYVFAEHSNTIREAERIEKVRRTGSGMGGSGGVDEGRVKAVTIADNGHMLPLERPHECAKIISGWLDTRVKENTSEDAWWAQYDSGKSNQDQRALSKLWQANVRSKAWTPRPSSESKL